LESDVPPRTITRKKYESAIPAIARPYTNFQPHLFQQSGSRYESPYQISSRIIITNSGEVQYERNVLGKKSQHHGGFHFKDDMPLPPRTHAGNSTTKVQSYSSPRSPNLNKRPVSSPTLERKSSDPQLSANCRSVRVSYQIAMIPMSPSLTLYWIHLEAIIKHLSLLLNPSLNCLPTRPPPSRAFQVAC
jgi:hypothetical protein